MESDLVPLIKRNESVNLTPFDLVSDYCRPYQLTLHLVVGALIRRQHLVSKERQEQ